MNGWDPTEKKSNVITEHNIQEAGEYARSSVSSICGNCGKVADRIEMYLNDQGLPYKNTTNNDYGVIHVRVGCDKSQTNGDGVKHYIFRIRGHFLEGDYRSENWVWIDAAFDQFCDNRKENGDVSISYGRKSEIDDIRVMRAVDDPRMTQYTKIGDWI